MIRDLRQHAVVSRLAISHPRCLRGIATPLFLPGDRLVLATVVNQVLLHLLLRQLYLVLNVVVSFVNVSNLLEPLQLFIVFSSSTSARVVTLNGISSKVPVNDMKVALLAAEVYGVNPTALPLAHAVEDILLDVLAHVLNDGTLSLHGCCLLIFGLLT